MKEGYDKEAIYDEKISPLMKQIVQICKDEGIPMLADFYLRSPDMTEEDLGDLHCITYIPAESNTPEHFPDIKSRMYNRGERTWAMAVTVMSGSRT